MASIEEFDDCSFEEIEQSMKELDGMFLHIDILAEHFAVLVEVQAAIVTCRDQLTEVEQALSVPAWEPSPFILGHLYSAAVGVYEVFMRDFICSLTESQQMFDTAVRALSKPLDTNKHINVRNLKIFREHPSRTVFKQLIYKATLLDAQKIADSVKAWFEIDIPLLKNSEVIQERRNLFSHNGGKYHTGKIEFPDKKEVMSLLETLDETVALTAQMIAKRLDVVTAKIQENL